MPTFTPTFIVTCYPESWGVKNGITLGENNRTTGVKVWNQGFINDLGKQNLNLKYNKQQQQTTDFTKKKANQRKQIEK